MKSVNLLPPRYRPARASGERPGIGYAALGALAVVLLMVLLYVVTQNGINDAKDKKAQADTDRQVYEAKAGALSAYGSFATLKTQRESAVVGLAEVRFDWERAMREIALLLPHNTFLTTFNAAPGGAEGSNGNAAATGPLITLQGCAPSHNAVAAAIVRLRKLHNAVDVDLQSSNKATAGASGPQGVPCRVTWNATVSMKAETAPTAPAAVPARLGGGQ